MSIPVFIVTGFLGSGKTTLLNRLIAARALADAPDKLAIVVNELGEIGIDGALLPAEQTRQVELPGGCVCCVLNDDLDRSMLELIERTPDLAAIVIETTGVAEPLPIAWAMEKAPLASRVRLAAVITLVDVVGFVASRPISPAVDAQVEYADVVVLTKRDLATPAQEAEARAAVTTVAPRAPVVAGTPDEQVAWLQGVMRDPGARNPDAVHVHGHGHVHGEDGAHGIDSVWVPIERLIDLEELLDALAELPAHYVRIKGIARVVDGRTGSDAPHWAAFHRVGLRTSSEPIDRPGPSAVVALGPGVGREALAACVERAVIS